MTRQEVEPLIISELRSRLPRVPYRRSDAGIDHYFELRRARPDLFSFRCHGSQWTTVKAWMLKHGLIVTGQHRRDR